MEWTELDPAQAARRFRSECWHPSALRRPCIRRFPAVSRTLGILVAVWLAVTGAPEPGRAAGCKLALVLALDISASVNAHEYGLQMHGLVRAFRSPEIADAILTPEGAGIAVTVFEWSGYMQQDVVVPWMMIDSHAAIAALANRLAAHRRRSTDLSTALGRALDFAARLFDRAPACERRVIDLSGDGVNNNGDGPETLHARGLLAGITVNGLVIQGEMPDPAEYYRRNVVHGPGAFLALARDFTDFPEVMHRKLLREIDQALIVGELTPGRLR